MLKEVKKMWRDSFTGIDNKTYNLAKFSWLFSSMAIIAVMVHRAWHGQDVDLMAASGALTAIATGHSAAIWGIKSQEPTL